MIKPLVILSKSKRRSGRSGRFISELSTILLALGMAFLVWLVAVREENPTVNGLYSQRIPLKVIPSQMGLILVDEDGIPSQIQVRIRAPQSSWDTLSPDKFLASVDLSQESAGLHTAPVHVEVFDNSVTVLEVLPPQVSFQLDPLIAKRFPVTVRVLDEASLGYFNRPPVTEPISVTVTGPERLVNEVDQVVARISLAGSRETVKQVLSLELRNASDLLVRQVTVQPSEALVTIPIEQRFGYKDVSVKAVVTGQPASGYWISSISVEPTTLTLRGSPDSLETITGLVETEELNIEGRTDSLSEKVSLNLPSGATVISETGDPVNNFEVMVTVGITALEGGRTIQTGLTGQGLAQPYTWTAAPDSVELILSGPLPVLQNLTKDEVKVILNLFDLTPGVYRLQPDIIKPDEVRITSIIPDTVEVTIRSGTATTTPTSMPMPQPTQITAPTPTVMPTPSVTTSIESTLILTPDLNMDNTTGLTQPGIMTETGTLIITNSTQITDIIISD